MKRKNRIKFTYQQNARQTAIAITNIIEIKNIVIITNCLTRVRLTLKENINYDVEQIKKLENVIEVLVGSGSEIQIILKSDFVGEVKNILADLISHNNESNLLVKKKINWLQNFFIKFASIFSPMIIGFIGAGLLSAIAGIICFAYGGNMDLPNINKTAVSWYRILNLILEIWKNVFIIIIGWKACEIFGGSGVIGAMIATIYCPFFTNKIVEVLIIDQTNNHVNFIGIEITDPFHNWLTVGFHPELKTLKDENGVVVKSILSFNYPFGNILGVLMSVFCAIYLEKLIRKIMPSILKTIGTSTITLFSLLIISFFLLIPLSGYLYIAIAWLLTHISSNFVTAFALAVIFQFAVIFGIHQGFAPIYAILINQTGVNGLFAIFAMAGMSQVGSAISVWLLAERKSIVRKQIQSALIPTIFGIGEPMLYKVILPRMRCFVTSTIASGFAGLFMAICISEVIPFLELIPFLLQQEF